MDIATTIKFRHVCDIAEKIRNSSKAKNKEIILQRYYESFQRHRLAYRQQMNVAPEMAEDGSSCFFPVLRCLLPQVDYARKAYDLQITALGAVYIKVLQLPADSRDAVKLKARSYTGRYEDYADIVYNVLKPRCREQPSDLTLKDIHEMLDSIAEGDRRNTEMVLTRLYEEASAQEQKWFIRMILKSMGLGLGEQRIFTVLHPQCKELYMRCSSLKRVCILLADINTKPIEDALMPAPAPPKINLNTVIAPFQHIKPMLCERFPGDIEQIMASDVLFMETKMDGERFQLHYANGCFKYLSRNGSDYTESFGANFTVGSYTPLLRGLWPQGLQTVILDGEMMVWDELGKRLREKGENTDVKHLNNNPNWRPCFVVYDLLYLNGQSLLDMSYAQRQFRMQELIREKPHVLQKMQPKKVGSVEEFMELFKAAIEAKAEGIVLKKQNSNYLPGVRYGGGWYKDKADYIKGLTTDFDLLIIGGFYNRTRTFIESFLLGVIHKKSEEVVEVYSVGKVANVIRQRANLNSVLKEHWKPLDTEPPPIWYHYVATNAEGRPDVWIEPRNSAVLQIRAADLAPSSAFSMGKSLHFPRIDAWRNDKLWNECMTLQEYKSMYEGQKGLKKLDKRETRLEDFTVDRKRMKLTPAEKRRIGLEAYEKRFVASEVRKRSGILDGFSVCVLSGSPLRGYPTEKIKTLAVSLGAEIVENPIQDEPRCINVAGDMSYRIEVLTKSRRFDILKLDWLLKLNETRTITLRRTDMVSMTPELENDFKARDEDQDLMQLTECFPKDKEGEAVEQADGEHEAEFGDEDQEEGEEIWERPSKSYSVEAVTDMLSVIAEDELENFMDSSPSESLISLRAKLYADEPRILFEKFCGYFLDTDPHSNIARLEFDYGGGSLVSNVDAMNGNTKEYKYGFVNALSYDKTELIALTRNTPHPLVSIRWILDSVECGNLLDVSDYNCENLIRIINGN